MSIETSQAEPVVHERLVSVRSLTTQRADDAAVAAAEAHGLRSNSPLTVIVGDCREALRSLPSESVQCCVTSPPYWGLRDYGHADQIGQEATVEEYVSNLVRVFCEVHRVLRADGTLWLNLGDTYAGGGNGGGGSFAKDGIRCAEPGTDKNKAMRYGPRGVVNGVKSKDLIGIPWLVAFALRSAGWYLRQDIIWAKPNPMPESVTDRCTKSHEYLFLLTKSPRYYYDQEAIKEPIKDTIAARLIQDVENQQGSDRVPGKTNGTMKAVRFGGNKQCPDTRLQSGKEWNPKMAGGGSKVSGHSGYFAADGSPLCGVMANKKSVWTITTRGYKGAHFATFPATLITPCILAGTKPGDVVLDPFGGSGTTGATALTLGRRALLIELNPEYAKLIEQRTATTLGLGI